MTKPFWFVVGVIVGACVVVAATVAAIISDNDY